MASGKHDQNAAKLPNTATNNENLRHGEKTDQPFPIRAVLTA